MAELEIYDSQGERYDADGVEVDRRIENFFFGGVRVYLDVGSTSELIVFFRARESRSGRAEQYYAVYRTEDLRKLFSRFKRDLRRRVEGEYGMTLQTTSDDVELFTKLDTGRKPVPGSSSDHRTISSLLDEGRRLRYGVPTTDDALGLFHKYIQGDAGTVAIGESTAIDELEDCDLTIEIGDYDGLEPLGETADLVEDHQQSSAESPSGRPRATSSGTTATEGKRRTLKLGLVACLGLVGLVVVAVAAINVAALLGVSHAAVSPIVLVDADETAADDPEPTLENVTIDGAEVYEIDEIDENETDPVEVVVNESEEDGYEWISISGESNQEKYNATLSRDGDVIDSDSGTFSDDFDFTFDNMSNGEAELRIAVGDDPDSEEWPAREIDVVIDITGVSEADDGDSSDDTAGDDGNGDTE